MTQELAMIKDVSFGCRDTNRAALWFTVELLGGWCSLQRVSANDAIALIEKHGITNIRNLEGKACVVESDRSLITFVRLL